MVALELERLGEEASLLWNLSAHGILALIVELVEHLRTDRGAGWKSSDELGATIDVARALDRAAVGVDDPLCQRQAEAGARWRAFAGALAAIEPLEDMRQIAGVDADAGVGDPQDDVIVLEPDVNGDDSVWPVVQMPL